MPSADWRQESNRPPERNTWSGASANRTPWRGVPQARAQRRRGKRTNGNSSPFDFGFMMALLIKKIRRHHIRCYVFKSLKHLEIGNHDDICSSDWAGNRTTLQKTHHENRRTSHLTTEVVISHLRSYLSVQPPLSKWSSILTSVELCVWPPSQLIEMWRRGRR